MDYRIFYFEPAPRSNNVFLLQQNDTSILVCPEVCPFIRLIPNEQNLNFFLRRYKEHEVINPVKKYELHEIAKNLLSSIAGAFPVRQAYSSIKSQYLTILEGKSGQFVQHDSSVSSLQVLKSMDRLYKSSYIKRDGVGLTLIARKYKELLDKISF